MDHLEKNLREIMEPYLRLRDAVRRWDALGHQRELTAAEREVVRALDEIEALEGRILGREIQRMIATGEANDIADALMVGTTETQLPKGGGGGTTSAT